MKTYIIICSLVILILSLNWDLENNTDKIVTQHTSKESKSNITITISMDTNTFLEGQEVWVNVEFKNEGDKPDSLANISEFGVFESITLKNSRGELLEFKGLEPTMLKVNYVRLEPKETKIVAVELRNVFGDVSQFKDNVVFSPRNYFALGTYTLRINKVGNEADEIIKSNNLSFSIVKPIGEDERVSQLLSEIYKMTERGNIEKKSKINAYKGFLENYKTSMYFDQVFDTYIRMKAFNNIDFDKNTISEIQNYVENNPNKFQTYAMSWYLAKAMVKYGGGKDSAKHQLDILINNYPNTRLTEGIKNAKKSSLFKNN